MDDLERFREVFWEKVLTADNTDGAENSDAGAPEGPQPGERGRLGRRELGVMALGEFDVSLLEDA